MTVMTLDGTLRSRELCERAGVTYKQLDYWTGLGLLETLGPPRPGYGAQRTYAPQEVAVARFLALVAPWLGPGSRLSRARVQMMCEQIREGDRGTPQLVPGVTVDLDLVCGGTTPS